MKISALLDMKASALAQWLVDNENDFDLVPRPKTKRLRILEALKEGPSTANEIALTTGIDSACCRALVSQFSQSHVVVAFGTLPNPKGRDATIRMLPEQKQHQSVSH